MYQVELAPHARRELRRVKDPVYKRLREKLLGLAENPRPPGCVKLTDSKTRYRLRVGDWRVLYSVDDETRQVTIHRIAKRDKAYG